MDIGSDPRAQHPWRALWALVFGFFMIMVDSTIVTIALPQIIAGLGTDITGGMWVTSAYLLAYVVPLLLTGRLGDRFGPKNLYVVGLVLFTLASVMCGLSTSIGMLVAARVAQGLGASCISPQTMSAITQMFPGRSRGPAMAVWGATAGVATLVGPLLGGILTDSLGWEWIFFVNIPFGIAGVIVALRFVPRFPLRAQRPDWLGTVLSAAALFLIVFGIQEGENFAWGTIVDGFTVAGVTIPLQITVWGLVIGGLVMGLLFVAWQAWTRGDPLVPLSLFRDRNFSLANGAVCAQAFAMTTVMLPIILYLQTARGLDPTLAALMLAPSAVMSIIMARPVGRSILKIDPKWVASCGFVVTIVAAVGMFAALHTETPFAWLLMLSALFGLGSSMVWSPLSLVATFGLPLDRTGAGSGVYNALRQVGAVLGSAAITAAMEIRITAHIGTDDPLQGGVLPSALREPFSRAMAEAVLVPTAAMAVGLVLVLGFRRLPPSETKQPVGGATSEPPVNVTEA